MYQQKELIENLLKEYPEFVKIGKVTRQHYTPKPGPGRKPKQTNFELAFIPLNDETYELAKLPGVYIYVKDFDTKDFYIGHAGFYDDTTTGFLARWSKYKAGLNQTKVDTNSIIAEHIFSCDYEVYFAPNPQAIYKGKSEYFGEDLETLLIRKYNPILNKRNR